MSAVQKLSREVLLLAISAGSFSRWLAQAPAGARLVYAQGPSLDRDRPVVRAVNAAIGAGEARAFCARREGGGWDFIVEKAEEGAARGRLLTMDEDEAALLDLLHEGAGKAGRLALPGYGLLACGIGLCGDRPGRERARYLVRKLEGRGLIRLSGDVPRIVTILASGKRTGEAKGRSE